jgi:hypothetical protein
MTKLRKFAISPSWAVSGAVIGIVVLFGISMSYRRNRIPFDENAKNPIIARNQKVKVGGVERPQSDVNRRKDRQRPATIARSLVKSEIGQFGTTPQLDPKTNIATSEIYESITKQINPEKNSVFAKPRKFDLESYRQDPTAYLTTVEPGRVWESAQPSDDTPILRSLVPPLQLLHPGESVRLRVKAAAGFPVTFLSLDLGAFSNELPVITVASDEEGVAEALFTATRGTGYGVRVLAASPGASEQISIRLVVKPSAK